MGGEQHDKALQEGEGAAEDERQELLLEKLFRYVRGQKTEDPYHTEESVSIYMENIRVLIKSNQYADIFHKGLELSSDTGLYVDNGRKIKEYEPGSSIEISKKSFQGQPLIIYTKPEGRIRYEKLVRSEKGVSFRGKLECYLTEEGIVIVNELPVEEYLYGVVPSEMPVSYPMEALKAQAISARTYAYYHMQQYAYPTWKAHLDDSTSYQVYQNIPEREEGIQAVDATRNLVITYDNQLIESFYYATSSGYASDSRAWGKEESLPYLETKWLTFGDNLTVSNRTGLKSYENGIKSEELYKEYIDQGSQEDIEYEEDWYRWEYTKSDINCEDMMQKIWGLYAENPKLIQVSDTKGKLLTQAKEIAAVKKEKAIKKIEVAQRLESGLVNCLSITTMHYIIKINTQQAIRQVLAVAGDTVMKKNGAAYTMGSILPSAYFYIESIYNQNNIVERIIIHGGGMGHGVGMSQNGAKCLAKHEYSATEILSFFYKDIVIRSVKK